MTAIGAYGPCQAVCSVQLGRRVAVVDDDGVAAPSPLAADANHAAAAGLISMRSPSARVMPCRSASLRGPLRPPPERARPPLREDRRPSRRPNPPEVAVAPDQAVDSEGIGNLVRHHHAGNRLRIAERSLPPGLRRQVRLR